MAQIDEFFFDMNRVEGITETDYERAKPYVEAAQAFAQSTYQSIYIIDYFRKNFLYVSDNPLFLCGHTADEVRQMGYGFYINNVPADEQPMLTELNRAGFRAFDDVPLADRRRCVMSYDFHILTSERPLLINHKITPLVLTADGRAWLALCTVSLSPHKEAGQIRFRFLGQSGYRQYSLTAHRWQPCEGVHAHPRGKTGAYPLSAGLHHEGNQRPHLPLVRHGEVLPPPTLRETRRRQHHRGHRLCHQLRPFVSLTPQSSPRF